MALIHVGGEQASTISIWLAVLASVSGLIYGFEIASISDIVIMDGFLAQFGSCSTSGVASTCSISAVLEGFIVSVISIGTAVGALVSASAADALGRRRTLSIACVVIILGEIVQITSFKWHQLVVGRFISGLGLGAGVCVGPMYQAETVPTRLRGILSSSYQILMMLGFFVAYITYVGARAVHSIDNWRIVVGISMLSPLVLGVSILSMPESPRWLAMQGRDQETLEVIARIRGIPNTDVAHNPALLEEVENIRMAALLQKNSAGGWIDCFKTKDRTLYRTLLGMSLSSFRHLSGSTFFYYYTPLIFKNVGIQDPVITQFIIAAVNLVCNFGGIYVMARCSRRFVLILGALWGCCWLLVFSISATIISPSDNRYIGYLSVISVCMFFIGYASAWGPVVWLIPSETFASSTRAKQSALSGVMYWIWNFIIGFFSPFIVEEISWKYGLVFAGCNLMMAVVVYLTLYETLGRSLEDVNAMYQDPKCMAWHSSQWTPYVTARTPKKGARPSNDSHRREKRSRAPSPEKKHVLDIPYLAHDNIMDTRLMWVEQLGKHEWDVVDVDDELEESPRSDAERWLNETNKYIGMTTQV